MSNHTELGLYDYRNRFYDPILGRFVQSDPIGFAPGDANLFRYCAGDPVNCTDPLGLEGSFYGDLNKVPWDGPLGPRGQLFFSGVGNLSIGVLSGVGVVGLSGATYGFGTVAAVTVFGHGA